RGRRQRLRPLETSATVGWIKGTMLTFGGFALLCLTWNFFLYEIGENPFFHQNPKKNAFSQIALMRPEIVDGFTISAFSGTYILHFLWVFPSAYIAMLLISG